MSDCVFCQKIGLGEAVRDTHSVYSFTPLNPVTEGHRLFVPEAHVEHGDERAPIRTSLAIEAAHTYAQAMGEDFNLITSSGPSATQTIPHIHIHYVPRRPGDGLTLPWTGQEKTDDQDD